MFGCGAGVGVGTGVARGDEAAFSDAVRSSPKRGKGVFCGLGVSSSSRSDLDFAVFFVLSDASVALDFFFAIVGFGVGVWRRFVFGEGLGLRVVPFAFPTGVGDFFGFGGDAARVSVSSD
jgi:hypothetical protein